MAKFLVNEVPVDFTGECIVIINNYTVGVFEHWLCSIKRGNIIEYIKLIDVEQA